MCILFATPRVDYQHHVVGGFSDMRVVGLSRRVVGCSRRLTSPVMSTISVVASSSACAVCGRHGPAESLSLVSGPHFPRDVILLAVRLSAAAERLAECRVDASGRAILRWVQGFGPALAAEAQRHRRRVATTRLVDETSAKDSSANGTTCTEALISTDRSGLSAIGVADLPRG